ncbi:LacI family transcriptional regulator [Rhodobacter sp. JA431]|uniref:LacI family DNA-binding transcriptional regulator n=1 Tax=Rhodobacter sp. JA431 TaxID=570013 RepID=UPI000BC52F13|nr:LacI family DNA-binding transcriptional regulator [Rhodobacter sp. JA431]SOC04186.1 LacI family transcriptional regulator [Rhodobacter sp. JA431]
MKPTQKHTIHDIAMRIGTSASTVSAALNGTWKARRIKEETAQRIIALAREMGYSVNLQARGLRTARSGLVGLILPEHSNRFFSDLSQSFTVEARARSQCPVIIATARKPEEELSTVRDLMGYSIDALFVAGAADPGQISDICRAAQLPHVFIDQPCPGAPSVITDNETGARQLTEAIIDTLAPHSPALEGTGREKVYLLGGDARLHASSRRIAGFQSEITAHFGKCDADQVIACGYEPEVAQTEIQALYARLGGLPAGLFANSINVFEEVLRFLSQRPEIELGAFSLGCFDYEPYGALLRLPVHMVRQRHLELVRTAWELLDKPGSTDLVTVPPEMCLARPRRLPPEC